AFSPDGVWIYRAAIVSGGFLATYGAAVYRTRADGSGVAEQVGYEPSQFVGYDSPTVSPDGMRVAMTVDRNGHHVQIVPATPPLGPVPNEVTHLTPLPTGESPRWSPVADELLMFGAEGMWIMPAGASSVSSRRYLAQQWSGLGAGGWSKDGKWIVARGGGVLILVEVATGQ